MATLNIAGRDIEIDDAFKSLSPDEQNRTVEEIAGQIGAMPSQPSQPQQGSGAALNATAGVNEGLYGVLGAPVDLMRGAMNLGIRGVNAATGSDLGTIPSDSFGGSQSIAGMMGAVHPALDPSNTQAVTTGEKVARGFGQGVGYTVAPEAAVGALARGGQLAGPAAEMAGNAFGRGNSVSTAATNAAVGGASGAGASAAMEAAPDQYKPLAGLVGGLGAGLGAAATAGLPALARGGAGMARDYAAPMSPAGRERIAADRMYQGATDPQAARQALDAGNLDILSGSKPTTFQATGDMGLGAMERTSATKRPDLFQQRRADQNAARVDAVTGLEKAGAPEQVASAVRGRLKQIDDASQGIVDKATNAARASADNIGQGMAPEAAGDSLRGALEVSRKQAKDAERALWDAVDPNGSLALSATSSKQQATRIAKEIPKAARPPEGEEAAVLGVFANADNVVPFREMTAAQSRLKEAMRAERTTNGESQAYRRMAQMNAAIEKDLTNGVASEAGREASAVQAGQVQSADTIAGRLHAGDIKAGTAVFTPSGRRVETEFKVVDGDSLTHSGQPNFPAGLQPRDRSRAASELQVNRMANDLQPERLGASSSASDGAPIVGPDGVVESGNGRVQAITRANQQGGQSAKAYRQYLESQGFKTDGMKNPVLVRVRKTPMDDAERARFTQEANASSTLGMSAGEQAATDAGRLSDNMLSLYRGGDLTAAQNRDFAKAFLRSVPEAGQEASFVTADGKLSLDGAQRMRNAVLHAAYEDAPLVAALAETGDEDIRVFGRALSDIAGDVARVKAGIKAGRVDASADISGPLVEAGKLVQDARRRGVRIADAIAQQDAFSQTSPEALEVLKSAYGDDLLGRLSREQFDATMKVALSDAEKQTTDARLFGEPASISEILQGASGRYGRGTQATTQPRPVGDTRPGFLQSGLGDGRPGASPAGAAHSAGSGGARILDRPELAPNFDKSALGRLRAAREATSNRVGTFDNKALGPIRRRPSMASPYDMSSATVAGRVFSPGSGGFESVQTFRKAVGDPNALKALEGYAVDRLRKAAMRPDGTLDPAKVTGWRKAHADALRAFPDLDRRFADAAAASDTLTRVSAGRKQALYAAQEGILGRLVGLDNPDDVKRTIGGIFSAQDSAKRMQTVTRAIGANKEARQGLRKAIADYMTERFVGNTEAATSGIGTMKSDNYQNFVRRNGMALSQAGFTSDELKVMQNVADDLQRANRSLAAVKIPGQSNTAQDIMAARKGDAARTILNRIVSGGAGGGGFMIGGPITVIAGFVGSEVVTAMRAAGLQTVDDIIADALLNPARARVLLATPAAKNQPQTLHMLAGLYRRSANATVGATVEEQRNER